MKSTLVENKENSSFEASTKELNETVEVIEDLSCKPEDNVASTKKGFRKLLLFLLNLIMNLITTFGKALLLLLFILKKFRNIFHLTFLSPFNCNLSING